MDSSLVWNPNVRGFVDKIDYNKALKTQDPTSKSYRGVKPNFGGGNQEDWERIGSTHKKMKKLTTVLSKNQKLNSFNVPLITKKFERKCNLDNEVRKQVIREQIAARE